MTGRVLLLICICITCASLLQVGIASYYHVRTTNTKTRSSNITGLVSFFFWRSRLPPLPPLPPPSSVSISFLYHNFFLSTTSLSTLTLANLPLSNQSLSNLTLSDLILPFQSQHDSSICEILPSNILSMIFAVCCRISSFNLVAIRIYVKPTIKSYQIYRGRSWQLAQHRKTSHSGCHLVLPF